MKKSECQKTFNYIFIIKFSKINDFNRHPKTKTNKFNNHEKNCFCICENEDTDQLRGKNTADQHVCFRYSDGTIRLFSEAEILRLKPSSEIVQTCLCWTWKKTLKTSFLAMLPI